MAEDPAFRLTPSPRALLTTAADAVLAFVVLAAQVLGAVLMSGPGEPDLTAGGVTLLAASAAPLVVRRRFPVMTCLASVLATAIYGSLELPDPPVYISALIGLYTVAALSPRPRVLLAAAATAVLIAVGIWASGDSGPLDLYAVVVAPSTAWLLGELQRARSARLATAVAHNELLRAEQEERARRAVADERRRIARELHDVIAHHVTMMIVTAEAEASRSARGLTTPAQETTRTYESLAETGRRALSELRRSLGLLRGDDDFAGVEPQPTLASIAELASRTEETGLRVHLSVPDDLAGLPSGVDLAAYRVVQEAITNTLKHAGAAQVWVTVRRSPTTLEIEVRNDGNGSPPPPTGHGRGLVGIRERVASCGGQVTIGPDADGFRVAARLPLNRA